MRTGPRTSLSEGRIDYKELRKINPEAARKAVLEYLKTNEANIFRTAVLFGINRRVVYNIIRKDEEGDLKDRSKVPKCQPKKTSVLIEDKVLEWIPCLGTSPTLERKLGSALWGSICSAINSCA